MAESLLLEVVRELGDEENPRDQMISRDRLERWMTASDLNVLGAVYALVSDPRHVARVRPPLQTEEVSSFLRNYFTRCMRENPNSEWADSRYTAGWDVARLFSHWWKDPQTSPEFLNSWKEWLTRLYLDGSSEVRECIETATLEHVFEVAGAAEFFGDWLEDATLAPAYKRCLSGPKGFLGD